MHATHCLVGCILCLASFSVAAATNGESQDMGSGSAHAVLDTSAHSTSSSQSGELPDASGSPDQSGSADPGSPLSSGNDPDSPGPAAMHHAHVHHVGWQSLLPGSIQ